MVTRREWFGGEGGGVCVWPGLASMQSCRRHPHPMAGWILCSDEASE